MAQKPILLKSVVVIVFAGVVGFGLFKLIQSRQPKTRVAQKNDATANDDHSQNSKKALKTGHTKKVAEQSIKARMAYADQIFDPTHEQTGLLTPKLGDKPIVLQTFCLAPDGNIWACVGGSYLYMTPDEQFIKLKQEAPPMIQVYSPNQELVKQIDLPFTATAINFDSAEQVFYIGGEGYLAKISLAGKIIKRSPAPKVKNLARLKQQIGKQLKDDRQQMIDLNQKQQKRLNDRVAALRTKQKTAPLSKIDQKRLQSYSKRLVEIKSQFNALQQNTVTQAKIEETFRDRLIVKAIAIAENYLFVALLADDNYNYEVFRVNKEFGQAQKILSDMRGCCGRFDVKADGDDLWVADNIFFRVVRYDKNGKRLDAFGHKSTTDQHGFGGCCNPMNLQVLGNGDLLTAESSIGHIKRFSPSGQLLSYIGQAKIAGGCKNVAIGFDQQRNLYYMLSQDEHSICILRPKQ